MNLLSVSIRLAATVVVAALAFALPASAQILLTSGHIDLEVNWKGTAWQFGYEVEHVADYDLHAAAVVLGAGSAVSRPAGATWDFIGAAAGADIFVLPQTEIHGLPFLGISAEGTNPGLIAITTPNDPRLGGATGRFMQFQLTDVVYSGPADPLSAQVAGWTTGPGGDPTVWFSSIGGLTADDRVFFEAGDHLHLNWSFTEPGTYTLTWRASTILADSTVALSEPVQTTFEVVPEPGTVALLTVGLLGLAAWRRRS